MEAGHPCLFQQRHKHRQFFFHHTGIAKVRVFLPDRQLVINGHSRNCRMDSLDCLHRKAGAVFGTATVFVGAMIENGRAEAAAHPVAMHLHQIKTGLFCQCCCFAESADDLMDLPLRQMGNVGCHFLVQLFPQLIRGDLLQQNAGNVLEHGQQVGIALVQLGADFAIRIVRNLHDFLIKSEPLGIKQRFFKFAFAHRNIADDDHGTAALCDRTDLCKIFFLRQTKRGRRKNDAVFQLHPAIVDRTQNRFVHHSHAFFCAAFCSNVSSCCRSCAVNPSRFCASQSVKTR